MIGLLNGQVSSVYEGRVILNVNGVGYVVNTPNRLEVQLGQELTVYTYLAVREDALTLYGFDSAEDKEVFELLISISGIGPRLGLAILSAYTPAQIQQAISQGNAAAFSAVSGIGKKNAERIILELKNKIDVGQLSGATTPTSQELTSALAALGYSGVEVMQATQNIDTSQPISQQIKQALAVISSNK